MAATSPRLVAALAGLALTALAEGQSPPRRSVVERLLLDQLGFTASQLVRIDRGEAVTAVLPSRVDHEIVIAGAVRIDRSLEHTVTLFRDVERLESGARFLQQQRLSEPPRMQDFAAYRLPPNDAAALRRCRPGRCDVKLDTQAFPALTGVDWAATDAPARATTLVVAHALRLVEGYRARGAGGLAVYHDSERPIGVPAEFANMVAGSAPMAALSPDLDDVLLGYPVRSPGQTNDDFYWSVVDIGLKPVFRVNHMVIRRLDPPAAARYVTTTTLLYANHYFNTALEVRALFDDPARPGTHTLVTLNLARADGLTGLWGTVVKARVRSASRDALAKALLGIKRRAEAVAPG